MIRLTFITFLLFAEVFAFFNFFQNQQPQQELSFEDKILASDCNQFLCPDTLACVESPNKCPCPLLESHMKCVLPNSDYVCISRPAGDFNGNYDDPTTNWQVDAKDDNVRDCGWVSRAWQGNL